MKDGNCSSLFFSKRAFAGSDSFGPAKRSERSRIGESDGSSSESVVDRWGVRGESGISPRIYMTDEELILAYQRGDVRSFEILLTRYKSEIYNYIYRFLGDREGSHEAFQEVFERVIRSAHVYTQRAKFSTWLYTIAHNYCIDFLRNKKHRDNTVSLNDTPGQGGEDEALTWESRLRDHHPGPDQQVGVFDLERKLKLALDSINPDQKEVFLLRERQGLQFDQIAEIVGVSVHTVKSRMRYALEGLRGSLKKLGITNPF